MSDAPERIWADLLHADFDGTYLTGRISFEPSEIVAQVEYVPAYWKKRAEAAEAKLAKAVEDLGILADCVDAGCFCSEMEMATAIDKARTTLAELEDKTDE